MFKDVLFFFLMPRLKVNTFTAIINILQVTMSYYISASPTSNVIDVTASITNESLNSLTVQTCAKYGFFDSTLSTIASEEH